MDPEPPAVIRIAVIATYPSVRAGLRAMLAAEPGFELATPDSSPDVTVVDLDESGTPDVWPEGPAVLLAGSPEDYPLETLADGVPRAYLLKEATAAEIAAAVQAVARGLVVLDAGVAAARSNRRTPGIPGEPFEGASLSERESEVLRLVASGLPNKAIARQLNISEHTVKFHVGTILSKLSAASRTEAVTIAVRNGLLPL